MTISYKTKISLDQMAYDQWFTIKELMTKMAMDKISLDQMAYNQRIYD